jgi:inositol-1,3,4-trisphosphate 5/6-kinase/inositol-tetrakisphosphate 1-kinase
MTLIPSIEKMDQLKNYVEDNEAVIIQEFIQHDGVIVKVYVAEGQITASTRPSFKNMDKTGGKLLLLLMGFN